MFEIYTRRNGLLCRETPVLPFASRKAADRECRKLARAGVQAVVRTSGRAITSVPA